MDPSRLIPGDATLIENIVSYLKAKGIFDEFRHECLADVDTKSSFQNLNQRVDGYTSKFLATETWNPDLNKNDLRNKLRRHIDESGMLAVGADHVVEQVINPKIHPFFLPKIIEVVHQFLREQSELFNKKTEAPSDSSTVEKPVIDVSDGNASKAKTRIDPIADILSFSYSKTKPTAPSSAHGKTESVQQKQVDLKKKREEETIAAEKKKRDEESAAEKKKREEESAAERKKREEESTAEKKSITESVDLATEDQTTSIVSEAKSQCDKEKIKKEIKVEESESNQEASKKSNKEEMKLEKKKNDDGKTQNSEATVMSDDNKSDASTPVKASVSYKRPFSRPKQKSKPKDSSSFKDVKKHKKESSGKSLEKHHKHKTLKSTKELSSPTKSASVSKSGTKEKISCGDSSSNRTSDKKSSKLDSSRKESSESKNKKHAEKPEKRNISKKEQFLNESGSIEKGTKNIQYSSSHDSSQGSDQEKSSLDAKKEKKHFSKHTQKESIEKQPDKITKTMSDKKRSKDSDEGYMKKCKREKSSKLEHTKVVGEAAKISSRSNSFGSTSSVSSSSNASKDNLASNSDDIAESSSKDKKKKVKGKDPCQVSKSLPPPPPPPPPSGAITMEVTSSTEMSSMEDTQSSSNSEKSSSEESTEESSSDSESESPLAILEALEKHVPSSSVDDINDFYDIFLYSSSSEDFEGYGTSPEKKKPMTNEGNSDVSVSSVHTSDLSSFDDELSDDGVLNNAETEPGVKKRFTLKEAQQLIQTRALLQQYRNKIRTTENKLKENSNNAWLNHEEKTSMLTSEDESSPSEPTRSLRRERKLNPRYASSEYTSIFNCKKESFITKQTSPVKKSQSPISSPIIEPKNRRRESMIERGKTTKKGSVETEVQKCSEETTIKIARKEETLKKEIAVQENSKKTIVRKDSEKEKTDVLENLEETNEVKISEAPKGSEEDNTKINSEMAKVTESQENSNEISVASKYSDGKLKPHGIKGLIIYTEALDNEKEDQLSSSDEMSSIMDKEHLYRENNDKTDVLTVSDHLKVQFQFKPQNTTKLNINSHSTKRKLQMEETPPAKRPCSRSSIDSSSSESVANENKPFNTGKQNLLDEKILRDHNDLKTVDLADKIKNDLFCKKNNNGDILGQKDILLNSHGKAVSMTERKTKESDSSMELNSL